MGILAIIGEAIRPISNLIDSLHTSAEEKGQLVNELTKIENSLSEKMLEYEAKIISYQADVVKAEAQGSSWLQRNWRPITMLTFLVLVVCDSFGWLAFRLSEEAWQLLEIGMGGYVIGRSVEKVAPSIMERFGKK